MTSDVESCFKPQSINKMNKNYDSHIYEFDENMDVHINLTYIYIQNIYIQIYFIL